MIIFINGPPQSGKDTATRIINEYIHQVKHLKLSAPMKSAITRMFNLSGADLMYLEDNKDVPLPLFNGNSYRDMQISLFNWLERTMGEDVLGKLLVIELKKSMARHHVISDSGKNIEMPPIIDHVGRGECYLLKLERPNLSYKHDIREPINENLFLTSHVAHVSNRFDLELYHTQIERVLREWKLIE